MEPQFGLMRKKSIPVPLIGCYAGLVLTQVNARLAGGSGRHGRLCPTIDLLSDAAGERMIRGIDAGEFTARKTHRIRIPDQEQGVDRLECLAGSARQVFRHSRLGQSLAKSPLQLLQDTVQRSFEEWFLMHGYHLSPLGKNFARDPENLFAFGWSPCAVYEHTVPSKCAIPRQL